MATATSTPTTVGTVRWSPRTSWLRSVAGDRGTTEATIALYGWPVPEAEDGLLA